MRKSLVLYLSLLLPLAACGDDDPIGPEKTGSLSFTYSGDISGTFSVTGEPPQEIGDNFYPQNDFAYATAGGGDLFIVGVRPAGRPKFDFFSIEMEQVTRPRTIHVCPIPGNGCPNGFLVLGSAGRTVADRVYRLVSETIIISEISNERVRGSFHGAATAINLETGNPITPARIITITNGQFDLPVRNGL